MMTSYIWHCFRTYCTKKYRCLLHFSIILSHSACRAQQCLSKTKSIRPRPRPRPVWDQSCHKTAVSDPKTAKMNRHRRLFHIYIRLLCVCEENLAIYTIHYNLWIQWYVICNVCAPCSCCDHSRYKCRAGCLPHDYLHWNILSEKVNLAVILHHFNRCHFCMQVPYTYYRVGQKK